MIDGMYNRGNNNNSFEEKKMSIDNLLAIVNEKFEDAENGMQCVFVPVDDFFGVKLYFDKSKRDECYRNQEMCFEHGFAPEVGDTFDLPRGTYRYGYFSEIAVMAKKHDGYTNGYWWERDHEEELDQLLQEIETATGWYINDSHADNFGYINGTLVPIDFGERDAIDGHLSKLPQYFEEIEAELLSQDFDNLD